MVANFISKIFIYPTDSVWGIGADAKSEQKNQWIRQFKGRDESTPFSVLFSDANQLESYIDLSEMVHREVFFKVLKIQSTFLLPIQWLKTSDFGPWIYADSKFIGVRVLDLPWIKKITKAGPITTTSCNFTGSPAMTSLEDAEEFVKRNCPDCTFIYPDNKNHKHGIPSTIIKYEKNGFSIIREGTNAARIRSLLEI